jgi:hypothetical protein
MIFNIINNTFLDAPTSGIIYFLLIIGPFVIFLFFRAWTFFTPKPEKSIMGSKMYGQCSEMYGLIHIYPPIVVKNLSEQDYDFESLYWIKCDFSKEHELISKKLKAKLALRVLKSLGLLKSGQTSNKSTY